MYHKKNTHSKGVYKILKKKSKFTYGWCACQKLCMHAPTFDTYVVRRHRGYFSKAFLVVKVSKMKLNWLYNYMKAAVDDSWLNFALQVSWRSQTDIPWPCFSRCYIWPARTDITAVEKGIGRGCFCISLSINCELICHISCTCMSKIWLNKSINLLSSLVFQNLNVELKCLLQLVALCDNHVSLYQLTVERGTQLFKWVEKNEVTMPDNDTMADMYLEAVQVVYWLTVYIQALMVYFKLPYLEL